MRCTKPPAGGSGSWWAASCVDHAAAVTNWKPSGEKPRGQWKSTNQNRDSSSFVNGPDFIRSHGLSMCSGFQPGYQLEELVDGNDLCHGL